MLLRVAQPLRLLLARLHRLQLCLHLVRSLIEPNLSHQTVKFHTLESLCQLKPADDLPLMSRKPKDGAEK